MKKQSTTIEDYSYKVLKDYMVNNHNISIQKVSFGSYIDNLWDGALIGKENSDKWLIHIKKNMIPTRQNFTICHELSHYIYDCDFGKRTANFQSLSTTHSKDYEDKIEEKLADTSAGVFMIPDECIRDSLLRGMSFREICKKYGLSPPALKTRIAQYMNSTTNYPYYHGWESANDYEKNGKIEAVTFLYEEYFFPRLKKPSTIYEEIMYG